MLQPFQSQILLANTGSRESPTISSRQPSRQASTQSSRRPSITSNLPPSPTIVDAYERFHAAIGSAVDAMVSTESTITTTYGATTGGIQPPIPPPSPPSSSPPPFVHAKPSPSPSSPERRYEMTNQSILDDNNENNNNNHHHQLHRQQQQQQQQHNSELSNAELRRRFNESIHQQNHRSPSFHLGTTD